LALDLVVFNRKAHPISIKEATVWSVIWVVLALAFNLLIYLWFGRAPALEFLTAYLIERSLSFDNIFVFVIIFAYFNIPAKYQHRVLFWGILGAVVMRAVLIATGMALISAFHWVIYVFGAFLIYTGFKLALQKGETVRPATNPVVRLIHQHIPFTETLSGQRFFTRVDGRLLATPLLLVLMVIETSDLIFAVDSIPAIFGVTHDPFLIYTSNVFAILGLRAFYFLLAGVVNLFRYLKVGLGFILSFVGLKMLAADILPVRTDFSLAFILLVLVVSILASILIRAPESDAGSSGGR